MKRILITGKNSYVGNRLEEWLSKYPKDYEVHKISVRNDDWKKEDFSIYDSIVHVAGIVHQKENKKNAFLYYKINRDLTYNLAQKAKTDGVPHFIFLSTMSVYGLDEGVIDKNTPLKPKTHYGKSKLEAEKLICDLEDDYFKVAIIRPPMIYGKDCPGNYQRLRWLALKTPIFPDVDNKRSMIYIDHLSEYLRMVIDRGLNGLHYPQNDNYINTTDLVYQIAKVNNKKISFTKKLNFVIRIFKCQIISKVFGDLIYIQRNSEIKNINYSIFPFEESIQKTEE